MNAITRISRTDQGNLTTLEWRIVEMAKADGPRSLNPDGFWSRLSRDLFGLPVACRLANDGLEALRRFCVRAWYWDVVRTSDLRMLMDAGYSSRDAFAILAHVAVERGFTPSIEQRSD